MKKQFFNSETFENDDIGKKSGLKIGILGGLSWESTIQYYKIINQEMNKRAGGLHSAQMIIESYDFHQIESLQRNGYWEEIAQILIDSAKNLEKNGAEVIIIATNTLHKFVSRLESHISVPILHIADATGKAVLSCDYKRVLLLGTKYTMQEDFYVKKLINDYNIEVIVPDLQEQETVHNIIFSELCKGIINEKSRQKLLTIIENSAKNGAQAVVLGCTELPNIIKSSSLPILNTAEIHSLAVVDFALEPKNPRKEIEYVNN